VTINKKTKMGLMLPTDPRWVNLASKKLEEVFTDHAYCEQKAASMCISLILQYSDRVELVDRLAPIVGEEWSHFEMVLAELKKRGLTLGKPRKDEYVNELLKFQRKDGSEEDRLLEKLLTSALIEARSCERFRLLSLHLEEKSLRDFYHIFMVSDAEHYKVFLTLAKLYCGKEKTLKRWFEYLTNEADIMRAITPNGSRMH